MFDLYTAPTPSGWRASIALEEMGFDYRTIVLDFSAGQTRTPDFLALNPLGKIPVIVDHDSDGFVVFESAAIMIYLAERCGRFLGADPRERSRVLRWLMFEMTSLGPALHEAVFHRHFSSVKNEAAAARTLDQTMQALALLDRELAGRPFLAEDYSIADMAAWCTVARHKLLGIDLSATPHLARWHDAIAARPAAVKGLSNPPLPPHLQKLLN